MPDECTLSSRVGCSGDGDQSSEALSEKGPALAAEVVSNCGERRAQLFNVAGNNRFISVREGREPFLSLPLVADCSWRWHSLFI